MCSSDGGGSNRRPEHQLKIHKSVDLRVPVRRRIVPKDSERRGMMRATVKVVGVVRETPTVT